MKTIDKEDIETFLYEGNDKMIDFENKEIPVIHPDFVTQLRLRNGRLVTAPTEWREKIWNWWYINRKNEVTDNVLIQAARSMTGRPPSYRSDFVEITEDGERIPASREKIEKLRKYLEER